jgi:hypothetical protein
MIIIIITIIPIILLGIIYLMEFRMKQSGTRVQEILCRPAMKVLCTKSSGNRWHPFQLSGVVRDILRCRPTIQEHLAITEGHRLSQRTRTLYKQQPRCMNLFQQNLLIYILVSAMITMRVATKCGNVIQCFAYQDNSRPANLENGAFAA